MSDLVRWVFDDLVAAESYTFEINPNEGGSPAYAKHVAYQNTSAPDGKTLVFEGRDEVQATSFSGTLLTEAHFNALKTWYQKRRQVQLTDDLGRVMMIYITKFEPKRVRSALYPWKHTYVVDYTILDWPEPE